jgi:hypothetical protein
VYINGGKQTCTTAEESVYPPVTTAASSLCTWGKKFATDKTVVDKCTAIADADTCVADTDCVFKAFERYCFEGESWLKVKWIPGTSNAWYQAVLWQAAIRDDHFDGRILDYG